MALSGGSRMSALTPLLEVERTFVGRAENAAFDPKRSKPALKSRSAASLYMIPANPLCYRHPSLLRARCERPCCCAADERNELPPPHSITSSASASSLSGTVSPSALAVLRLMIKSSLVGCRTGRSAGLAPLRIRPV